MQDQSVSSWFLPIYIRHIVQFGTITFCKKVRHNRLLHFRRYLRRWVTSTQSLVNFYHCTINSVLMGSISVWYSYTTGRLYRGLWKQRRRSSVQLLADSNLYTTRCRSRALSINTDTTQPSVICYTAYHSETPGGKASWQELTSSMTASFPRWCGYSMRGRPLSTPG